MLNLFIINPVAGGGKKVAEVTADINAYFSEKGGNYKIEYTKGVGDAVKIAKSYAELGSSVRIFACGGDGTLHEVVNGIVGFSNVELGVIPAGTGNDYCATFSDRKDFLDIKSQVEGSAIPIDLIEYDGMYSINQCSIGFDALVASKMAQIKRKPVIGGKRSYIFGLLFAYLGRLANPLTVRLDDGEEFSGEFLFTIAAKGKYHGGGFKSAPQAEPANGKLNFMLVKKVSHLRVLKVLPSYIKGDHLKYTDIVSSSFGEKLEVHSKRPLAITLDGEIIYSEDFTAKIVKNGARFVIPAKVAQKTENIRKSVKVK